MPVTAASPSAAVKLFAVKAMQHIINRCRSRKVPTTISGTSGHRSSMLMTPIDSQADFLLVFCSDLRSTWNRCQKSADHNRQPDKKKLQKKKNAARHQSSRLRHATQLERQESEEKN